MGHSELEVSGCGIGAYLLCVKSEYGILRWCRCLRVLEGHRDAVRVIATHGSGRVFSGSYDSQVCAWDVA